METPVRKALREARLIILIGPLVALVYNLFASTGIPWIREVRQGDTVSYDALFGPDTSAGGSPSNLSGTSGQIDTVAAVDTTTGPEVTDTSGQWAQAEQKRIEDSTRKAQSTEAIRLRDSARKAAEAQGQQKEPPPLGKEINTPTARRIFDEKKALFIDARPETQFSEGHIPGAINVYAEDFNKHIPTLLGYPMDTLVVAYCGGGLCELSHELADQLRTLGFKKVVVYTGGTTEWNEKKYPFTGK